MGVNMKLSEFIENCQTILETHGDLDVIYSSDAEGNYFEEVYFPPSAGHYEQGDWICEDHIEEYMESIEGVPGSDTVSWDINAICIN
jgi:hypothetical protein